MKFTNNAPGARGINLKSGETLLVEAGATADVDEKDIAENGVHPDLEKGEAAAKKAAGTEADEAKA